MGSLERLFDHLNSTKYRKTQVNLWRIRIAAECARLESVCRATYRGFKSLILRQNPANNLMQTDKVSDRRNRGRYED